MVFPLLSLCPYATHHPLRPHGDTIYSLGTPLNYYLVGQFSKGGRDSKPPRGFLWPLFIPKHSEGTKPTLKRKKKMGNPTPQAITRGRAHT